LALAAALMISAAAGTPAAQTTTTDPLDRAARAYTGTRTLRADFLQTLTSPATHTVRQAAGELVQRGAARFALHFSEPAGDVIVCDGTSIWVYLPSTAKGSVMKVPAQLGNGFNVLTQLLHAPRESYVVVPLGDSAVGPHATAVYTLTPKGGNAPFTRATVWIGRADALLWQLETLETSGLIRRVRFTSVRTNVDLPDGATAFVVPAGVKIIDQDALFGRKP
jgi:outer membrane lipoprotein carrier protein